LSIWQVGPQCSKPESLQERHLLTIKVTQLLKGPSQEIPLAFTVLLKVRVLRHK